MMFHFIEESKARDDGLFFFFFFFFFFFSRGILVIGLKDLLFKPGFVVLWPILYLKKKKKIDALPFTSIKRFYTFNHNLMSLPKAQNNFSFLLLV